MPAALGHEEAQGVAVAEGAAALVGDVPTVWAATDEERRALAATVTVANCHLSTDHRFLP